MPFSQSKGSNGINKQMSFKIKNQDKNQNLMASVSTEKILAQPFK